MIDPRLIPAPAPNTVVIPEYVALEQELLDAGYTPQAADAALTNAVDYMAENLPDQANTAENLAPLLGVPVPPPALIAAARAAIAASQGGTHVATDPKVQQVLDQNSLIADALYDLTKLMAIAEINGTLGPGSHAALLQDAKTKVNALNPAKFTFP